MGEFKQWVGAVAVTATNLASSNHMMREIDLILALLVVVACLSLLARRIRIPHPILLVIGGLILGLVPGLPRIHLDPQLVLLIFLPPLLYPAALFTSWRDFRANLRPILWLAVGLVLFTTVATAWLAHALIGLPWATAFVLGAIISPPDAVAATAIIERLRVPRRIVAILEGESLVNDAASFTAFRFAVAAVMTGAFSIADASLKFLVVGIGGIVVGLGAGWIFTFIQRRLDDPPVQTTLSLLMPFATYLAAEALGVSGILAVVIAGLYIGWRSPEVVSSRMRLQAYPVWEMVVFILNGLIFILIGLQLPEVREALSGQSILASIWSALLVVIGVILIRIVWVFAVTYLPRLMSRKFRKRNPYPPWRGVALVAWIGMRGADSLIAALALPLWINNGSPFPDRDLIFFLTFSVILGTLVLQGLSLSSIIRWLGVVDDGSLEREERGARLKANQAALVRVNEISESRSLRPDTVHRLRAEYEDRIRQLEIETPEPGDHEGGLFSSEYEELAHEALMTERKAILQLRNERVINDDVLRRIQRDIDFAEARLKRPGNHPS